MSEPVDVILASASPRRQELLQQIGVRFKVLPVHIDEVRRSNESAQNYVQRLALEKAQAGWDRSARDLPVLGADTIVVIDKQILGKPANASDAATMLSLLSGREHQVLTAVTLLEGERILSAYCASVVRFRDLTAADIQAYCGSDEPMGKAGAYAIQGRAAIFVRYLQGSYSGVMGLPLFETAALLAELGVEVLRHDNTIP